MYVVGSMDSDPTTLVEAQSRSDWRQWQVVIEAEYDSLRKHNVFRTTTTDLDKPLIGHKLIFTRTLDAQGNFTRYKMQLVAQGFSQRSCVDFDQIYSSVMDTILFRFLLALIIQLFVHIYILDVVTAYLHGILDTTLHILPSPRYLSSERTPRQAYRTSNLQSIVRIETSRVYVVYPRDIFTFATSLYPKVLLTTRHYHAFLP